MWHFNMLKDDLHPESNLRTNYSMQYNEQAVCTYMINFIVNSEQLLSCSDRVVLQMCHPAQIQSH